MQELMESTDTIHVESPSTIYLFGVLRRFQHCTGHITTGSWKGRGNQYIVFARVVYCKLPTNGKQLPAFPLKAITGIEPRPQRWEARVLLLGANYRSARSRDFTCAISSSKDRAPISRLLKQSRDGAAPTHNDFHHRIFI